MYKRTFHVEFHSPLGSFAEKFLQEKRACGYRYDEEARLLRNLDRFLCNEGLAKAELPKELVDKFTSRRRNESAPTQQQRIRIVCQFAKYLLRQGQFASVPDPKLVRIADHNFIPRILSVEEIRRLFQAADSLRPHPLGPLRHLIMPELFRLLYGCGLRVGEACRLTVGDVDLHEGILTILQGKFRKDRLVPMTDSMTNRLRRYSRHIDTSNQNGVFFPAPDRGIYSHGAIYRTFRKLLWLSGIPHGGRGKGPRIHDLRHSHAVTRLVKWYRDGADLSAKLPVLATYLGHRSMAGTQHYLRLTADLFPDIAAKSEAAYGHVIPRKKS